MWDIPNKGGPSSSRRQGHVLRHHPASPADLTDHLRRLPAAPQLTENQVVSRDFEAASLIKHGIRNE